MENFRRSLSYLWPYRRRIGVALVCVLFIATLWGGGLALVLPGAKILLSDEGLHGWAWKSISEDHVGAQLFPQSPNGPVAGEKIETILDVRSTNEDGPLHAAGVNEGIWIVGIDNKVVTGRDLMRQLAQADAGDELALLVQDNQNNSPQTVNIQAAEPTFTTGLLKKMIAYVPEPRQFSDRFDIFLGVLILAMVATLLRAVFTFIQEYLVRTAIWRGVMDIRCENYNRVLHLPTSFFGQKGVSDATSRFIQDTNELARGQNTLMGKTLVEPAKAVACIVVALWCSWELTLLAMIAGPPAFYLISRLGKKMHKASKRALEGWSDMLAILGETLIGIRVVKAYTMEGTERRRFFRTNRRLLKQQNRKVRLDAATGPLVETLGVGAAMVAAGLAGYLVFNGFMDSELFLTWMVALFGMMDPVRKLAKVSMRFNESEAAAARIFELHDIPAEPVVKGAASLPPHRESVEFQHVTFTYPGARMPAVRDVSLRIEAGQNVAIVGPNGSGKTTLLSMIPRLFDPDSGVIRIDGRDISQVSLRSLRNQIGLVTQDTVLFHATVAENIAYGLRRARREDVLAASKQAFVDEFVQEMPDGYETMVGEHGATLSGGQKQRISIARAILRDPAIMIFDEAMSQVDANSERKIHEAMVEFIKGRTTMTIAHRFATVLSADMIVVMADGALVDSGTHHELLERCSLYAHLYNTQFADASGEHIPKGRP